LDPAAILVGLEADREGLRTAAREAGGPEALLRERYPLLAASCPAGWTEAALVAEATDWYAECEQRLALCAGCPPTGAACSQVISLVRPGQLPVWQGERVVAARCERYREWRLGQRLGLADVPERYRSARLSAFTTESDAQQAAFDAVGDFFEAVQGGGDPWLVLCGPHASGKTHLACAMLRGVPRTMPRKRFWYSDMNELRVAMKGYKFDSDDEDPTDRLRRTDLLVLDNLDTGKLAKEAWLKERIEDVLYQRWNRQRATLITTHRSLADLVGTFTTITTLGKSPSCSLV
jgi:DNA replication protein DnaC